MAGFKIGVWPSWAVLLALDLLLTKDNLLL